MNVTVAHSVVRRHAILGTKNKAVSRIPNAWKRTNKHCMSSSKKKIPKKYARVVLRVNASHTVTNSQMDFFKPITEDSEKPNVKARREKKAQCKK
jgi:hypothetical protein